jgi:hypothetical protein
MSGAPAGPSPIRRSPSAVRAAAPPSAIIRSPSAQAIERSPPPDAPAAASCAKCAELKKQVAALRESTCLLGEATAAAAEEAGALRAELAAAREDCVRDERLRAENERLLDVVYALKEQLDREPLAPEVLRELQDVKERFILVTLERDELVKTIHGMRLAEQAKLAQGPRAAKSRRMHWP